jgi:hypothetical protein
VGCEEEALSSRTPECRRYTRRQISNGTHCIGAFALVADLFLCAKHLFVAAMGVPMRATLAMVMAVRRRSKSTTRERAVTVIACTAAFVPASGVCNAGASVVLSNVLS